MSYTLRGEDMKPILDLSHYNRVTDWYAVKNRVAGVILRCAYRGYGTGRIAADNKFREYAKECKRIGLPFGIYFMSQAINEAEGIEEAIYTVNLAKEYGATLPLIIDSEDGDGTARVVRADGLSKSVRTSVVKAFCDKVNELGYVGGVYASESWFTSRLNYNELTDYYIWVADYGRNTGVKNSTIALKKYDLHQYTSRGSIKGVSGNVDLSEVHTGVNEPVEDSEEVYNMKTIRKGSKGKAVKLWQIIVGTTVDGSFGSKTYLATIAFQKKAFPNNPEEWDGIVGKKTWKAGLESV